MPIRSPADCGAAVIAVSNLRIGGAPKDFPGALLARLSTAEGSGNVRRKVSNWNCGRGDLRIANCVDGRTFQTVFNEVKADSPKWLRLLGPGIGLYVLYDYSRRDYGFLISASHK